MFFGSPHRGSNKAAWADIGTKIVSIVKLDAAQHLASSLKLDSEILEIIQSDFQKLLHAGDFYVHTFQEGRPINSVIGKVTFSFYDSYNESVRILKNIIVLGR